MSEVIGLRWRNVHADSITVDERYCRGDWGCPKSEASNATIAVNEAVIRRIHSLKGLKVRVRAGRAVRRSPADRSNNSGVGVDRLRHAVGTFWNVIEVLIP